MVKVGQEFGDVVKPLDPHAPGQRRHARDRPGPAGGEIAEGVAAFNGRRLPKFEGYSTS